MLSICDRCIIYDQSCFKLGHKQVTEGNKSQRETEGSGCVASRHLQCPLHYCRVYKGLINHIIAPHRIISPWLSQTVNARERFLKKISRLYLSFYLKQCCIWLGGFHKTLNLGNWLVASYLHCTAWSCVTQKCANTNHKVHWLLCLICHFHFLRRKK